MFLLHIRKCGAVSNLLLNPWDFLFIGKYHMTMLTSIRPMRPMRVRNEQPNQTKLLLDPTVSTLQYSSGTSNTPIPQVLFPFLTIY